MMTLIGRQVVRRERVVASGSGVVTRRQIGCLAVLGFAVSCLSASCAVAADDVAGQPLAANVQRVLETLKYLGAPLSESDTDPLRQAIRQEDPRRLQELLDPHVLATVSINPEQRVRVQRGMADPVLQQSGFTPFLIKVRNDAVAASRLKLTSPQAGPSWSGAAEGILKRQEQTELKLDENIDGSHRFLSVEIFDQSPMTERLSGLAIEYVVALIYSSEAGQREATLVFDIGQGTQDLGFRSELPVLFSIRPAIPVRMAIRDFDGSPTTARLEFRDARQRVFPPQARRLAPDFFFQPQVYRADGETVLLPPGEFVLESGRGPEYRRQRQPVVIAALQPTRLVPGSGDPVQPGEQRDDTPVVEVRLERWVNPAQFGYYSGDHHIHGAGCSHYDNPTQGVTPQDMFAQVRGEGLNVGCVLTWGPCFEHQRNFFSPVADTISEPFTILKYDLEISGFGSAALGHVCLLNLTSQEYPNSNGTQTEGWPTWTVPVMKWAKDQGGITGYPHSALHVDAKQAADWILQNDDSDGSGILSAAEAEGRLLPGTWESIDLNRDEQLTREELQQRANAAADELPNLALPAMDGGGAMEVFVSTAEGVCDFISAMDTARIPEWNTWYHLLNCGFPLKLSGETDFPCMSSRRVGQGRVYVRLGDIPHLDFTAWCRGIAAGNSYVSDGYAHAFDFTVEQQSPGSVAVNLPGPRTVTVEGQVAFAAEQPRAVAYGTLDPPAGKRMSGDTVNLHADRETGYVVGGERLVEVVVNGRVAAAVRIPADGQVHPLRFEVPVERSSWIALRQFPQLHTNPVTVLVGEKPVRASRASALWCAESTRLLWRNRRRYIATSEQPDARLAYERSLARFLLLAEESDAESELVVPSLTLD